MSIIEKAVNTLQKHAQSDKAGSQEYGSHTQGDLGGSVQKAAKIQAGADIVDPVGQQSGLGDHKESARANTIDHSVNKVVKIPFDSLQPRGFLTPSIPRSVIAEEYRTIKRPLLTNIAGHNGLDIKNANLIMVTSALQGDGKTFSSINLALSIAMEQDKTVLFVDADTAKAQAGNLLGVPPDSPGLIDVLENKGISVADVILRTNVEKLRILPAGNVHSHSNELLASEAMRRLMLELSERYTDRVVVFDSPPLLLTTEAAVLASFMGQIVFIVGAGSTPQHAITQAMEHIGRDKTVGVVLNRARKHSKMFSYGYGYGYGQKGYGYGNRDRESISGE